MYVGGVQNEQDLPGISWNPQCFDSNMLHLIRHVNEGFHTSLSGLPLTVRYILKRLTFRLDYLFPNRSFSFHKLGVDSFGILLLAHGRV